MKEVLCVVRSCQRPLVLIAPLIGTHDENPDRFWIGKLIRDVFEEMVVPGQSDFVFVKFRIRAEVDLPDLAG